MWEKLLEILFKKAVDILINPKSDRKKLAQAFVGLFQSIKACNKAYLQASRRADSRSNEQWMTAIVKLAVTIDKLSLLLDIKQPELLSLLKKYVSAEKAAISYHVISENVADDGEKTCTVAALANAIYEDQSKDDPEYDALISRLRSFLVDDLKLTPEELLNT